MPDMKEILHPAFYSEYPALDLDQEACMHVLLVWHGHSCPFGTAFPA